MVIPSRSYGAGFKSDSIEILVYGVRLNMTVLSEAYNSGSRYTTSGQARSPGGGLSTWEPVLGSQSQHRRHLSSWPI